MMDLNTFMMAAFAVIFVVLPMIKKMVGAFKARLERGELVRLHEETSYKRVKQIEVDSKGRPGRKSLFRSPAVKPVLVIAFDGDPQAEGHELFAKLADEAIKNRAAISEVVVKITSPGGSVSHYGLMNAHMERIRLSGLPLTACIDLVAASGGCLMAAPATKIIASRLAILGSIGVVQQLLNGYRLLDNIGIESITSVAGEHKRLLTTTDKPTEEAKALTEAKLKKIHRIFIDAVRKYRPQVSEAICDGDWFTADESMERKLGLVDFIQTSDEYLDELNATRDIVYLSAKSTKWETPFFKFTSGIAASVTDRVIAKIISGEPRIF